MEVEKLKHHVEQAVELACQTIGAVHNEEHHEGHALTDVDIDKVRDSMQILCYAKELMKP